MWHDFPYPRRATPVSHAVGGMLPASEAAVTGVSLVKILVSMAWVIVIAVNLTMGVAWHRSARWTSNTSTTSWTFAATRS